MDPAEASVIPVEPTREAGLARLRAFVPKAGRAYAAGRNADPGAVGVHAVSGLSPYVRHRLVTETELLHTVLVAHSLCSAEKFVQEVCWRTYWKGWLEHRPTIWTDYRRDVAALLDCASRGYVRAVEARTGIDCFDAWVAELIAHGTLHNHARMWFASIWVHTLGLPWQLGADFFLRHLLDGDAASNTLSWRWVCGLHTRGKYYLARRDNITRYTKGRFVPAGLATEVLPLNEPLPPPACAIAPTDPCPAGNAGLLLSEEDLHPESLDLSGVRIVGIAAGHAAADRSPHPIANNVLRFTEAAQADALARAGRHFAAPTGVLASLDAASIGAWARASSVNMIVTPYAPVGPARERIEECARTLETGGIRLCAVRRQWDELAWPHACNGFFAFWEHIPRLIGAAGFAPGA